MKEHKKTVWEDKKETGFHWLPLISLMKNRQLIRLKKLEEKSSLM
jgi:hypothetical protein